MQNYRILSKKGEGTFSEVMRAVNLKSQKQYAIKCMKRRLSSIDEVNRLFEIQALRKLAGHPHIVQLYEVLFEDRRLAIVFELMDMNLYEAIKDRKQYLPESRVRKWMYQLFVALEYMHSNFLFHRDVKPENLLVVGEVLKLADLGSCCPSNSNQPFTEYISTRWYRAPECLLTSGYYSSKMDIWAIGCVFYELMTLNPLFPGKNELDQIERIHSILGTPNESIISQFRTLSSEHLQDISFAPCKGSGIVKNLLHCSADIVAFIQDLLVYDPNQRMTAKIGLDSDFFAKFTRTHIIPPLKLPRGRQAAPNTHRYLSVQLLTERRVNRNSNQPWSISPPKHRKQQILQTTRPPFVVAARRHDKIH